MAAVEVQKQPDHITGNKKDLSVKWAPSKPLRTKARPKHSLFGTPLEALDNEELEKIRGLDVKQYYKDKQVKNSRVPSLPENMKSQVKGREIYEQSKDNVDVLLCSLKNVDEEMKLKQQKALSFSGNNGYSDFPEIHDKSHQWFTTKDLEHSNEINNVTLGHRNYNHAKYGKKPPVHPYSLMGDVMRPGMDLNLNQNYNTPAASPPLYGRRARPQQGCMPYSTDTRVEDQGEYNARIQLPPNIRHAFGSRVCDALLADREKSQRTLQEQTYKLRGNPSSRVNEDVVPLEREMNVNYEWLSNSMRQNVCPGYTMNHKQSTMKTVYTDDVFQQRLQDPDEFRYQRDELSSWNESNVLRQRMKKRWKEYLENAPKLKANWDRNVRRSKPEPQKPKPKEKHKTRKAINKNEKEPPPFDDVVFVSPPRTPHSDNPATPVPVAKEFKRDADFWNEYNRGIV